MRSATVLPADEAVRRARDRGARVERGASLWARRFSEIGSGVRRCEARRTVRHIGAKRSRACGRARSEQRRSTGCSRSSAAETLAPDIFVKTAPALRVHDAVWGGAAAAPAITAEGSSASRGSRRRTCRPSSMRRSPGGSGRAHFVRPAAALRRPSRELTRRHGTRTTCCTSGGRGSAYKTAQCLTHLPRRRCRRSPKPTARGSSSISSASRSSCAVQLRRAAAAASPIPGSTR